MHRLHGDGNDDFVTELSAAANGGKIRRKWKVVYTEDNDDTDSRQEPGGERLYPA